MKVGSYVNDLAAFYKKHGDNKVAVGAKAYMRNQFEFYGLVSPERKALSKIFISKNGIPDIQVLLEITRELWKLPQRELHYFAIEILEKKAKELQHKDILLLEYMIVNKSWWDTVDFIAPKLIGPLFKKHPEMILPKTKEWIASGNIWLMRSALLFQLKYKKSLDEKLLYSIIEQCVHEKDFFIRKAIGWILREHSKLFPATVKKFIKENDALLSPLSKKEGLKIISKLQKP